MLCEPAETFALLRGIHIPNLTDEDAQILAARVCGWNPPAAAVRLNRSERDIRRMIERLADVVCMPSGVERDPAVLGVWFALHIDCSHKCTARALNLIEQNLVFMTGGRIETI
jgi:hypothetical protein